MFLQSGYPYVVLRRPTGSQITEAVHRLVAETFLDGRDLRTQTCVNHIDGNRRNNHVENLEWLSNGENIRHGIAMQGRRPITRPIAVEILRLRGLGHSLEDVRQMVSVGAAALVEFLRGRTALGRAMGLG